MTTYDVFLSHASDDKPTVEALARRLREDGVTPFLDKWHLVPGEPWQEALEDALESSRTCAVFVGAKLGPWQNEEMRDALDERTRNADFRVIPVLLPGALMPGDLPRFLRRLTWVDFSAGGVMTASGSHRDAVACYDPAMMVTSEQIIEQALRLPEEGRVTARAWYGNAQRRARRHLC